jgi:hypothetical protein
MLRVHYATPDKRTPTHGIVRTSRQSYGGHSGGETPGNIPNPEAKPSSADGTAPGRVWESRTPPDNHTIRATPKPRGRPLSHSPADIASTSVASRMFPHVDARGAPAGDRGCKVDLASVTVTVTSAEPIDDAAVRTAVDEAGYELLQ